MSGTSDSNAEDAKIKTEVVLFADEKPDLLNHENLGPIVDRSISQDPVHDQRTVAPEDFKVKLEPFLFFGVKKEKVTDPDSTQTTYLSPSPVKEELILFADEKEDIDLDFDCILPDQHIGLNQDNLDSESADSVSEINRDNLVHSQEETNRFLSLVRSGDELSSFPSPSNKRIDHTQNVNTGGGSDKPCALNSKAPNSTGSNKGRKLLGKFPKSHVDISKKYPICHKLFTCKFTAIRHMCNVHPTTQNMGHSKGQSKDKCKTYDYECGLCQKHFPKLSDLTAHKWNVHNEKQFQCGICHQQFDHREAFRDHMHTHHTNKVGKVPEKFSKSNVDRFVKNKCKICHKVFSSQSTLNRHMRNIHITVQNMGQSKGQSKDKCKTYDYECTICHKVFSSQSTLNRHMRNIHITKPNMGQSERQKEGKCKKTFECELCQKQFPKLTDLTAHKWKVHNEKRYQCDTCRKKFHIVCELRDHMHTHTGEKPYKCDICEKSFSNKSYCRIHRATHSKEKTFLCNICLKRFRTRKLLKSHLKSHLSVKPYKCDLCQKTVSTYWVLKCHIMDRHLCKPGDNPYKVRRCGICNKRSSRNGLVGHVCIKDLFKCDVCQKVLGNAHNLRRHKISQHSSFTVDVERPRLYNCQQCYKSFAEVWRLSAHMRVHSDEKPFKCKVCGMSFKTPVNLRTHMNKHTNTKPFACKTCDKRFNYSPNLSLHMRVHTNEKPYMCEVCGMRFRFPSNITTHMRTHTNSKKYKCELCQKSFSRLPNLTSHLRTH